MPTDIRYIKNGEALNEDVIARPMEDIEANLTEIFKAGIPKWFSGTTYEANSYARVGDDIYVAKRQNLNKSPLNNPNDWVLHEGNRQATASDRGTVTISDSTTSNSAVTAASSKAAKTLQDDVNTRAYKATKINTGDGLNGGGNLGSNRTFSVDSSVLRDYHLQTDDYDGTDGRILTVGAFGLGSHTKYIGNASVTNNSIETGFYGYDTANGSSGGPSTVARGSLIHQRRASGGGETQIIMTEVVSNNNQRGLWIRYRTTGEWSDWEKHFHTGNMGAGSGLDADTVDGLQASQFTRSDVDDVIMGKILFGGDGRLNNQTASIALALGDSDTGFRWNSDGDIDIMANSQVVANVTRDAFNVAKPLHQNGHQVWHYGNMGAGSNMDADKLDGQHGSYYAPINSPSFTGTPDLNDGKARTIGFDNIEAATIAAKVDGTVSFDSSQGLIIRREQVIGDATGAGVYTVLDKSNIAGGANIALTGNTKNEGGTVPLTISVVQGSGSGLDADKLDGQEGSFYRNAGNLNAGTIPRGRLPYATSTADGAVQFATSGEDTAGISANVASTPAGVRAAYEQYGLGSAGVSVSDPNGITTSGFYKIWNSASGVVNMPKSQYWTILHHDFDQNAATQMAISLGGELAFRKRSSNTWARWNTAWTDTNMGSGSGLDADKLDGLQASQFLRSDTDDRIQQSAGGVRFIGSNNRMYLQALDGSGSNGEFWFTGLNAQQAKAIELRGQSVTINGNNVWHTGNMGSGSGLDADKLDGFQSTQFLRSDTNDIFSGTLTGQGMNLGGAAIQSGSGASLQVKGFMRTGTIYLHDTNSPDASSDSTPLERDNGNLRWGNSLVWTSTNDGAGSGLDADKLDGYQASDFSRYKIVQDNGLAKPVAGDWNNYTETGFYTSSNTTNQSPFKEHVWQYTAVFPHTNSSWSYQLAKGFGKQDGLSYRSRENDTWDTTWHQIWDDQHMGSGSGLDADLLDGQHGSFYRNAGNLNAGTINSARLSGTYNINITGNAGKVDNLEASQFLRSDTGNDVVRFNNKEGGNFTGDGDLCFDHSDGHFVYRTSGTGSNYDGAGAYSMMTAADVVAGANINISGGKGADGSPVTFSVQQGSGSGLDADKLDGQSSGFYRNAGNLNAGTVPVARMTGKYNIDISGNADTSSQAVNADKLDGIHGSQFVRSDVNDVVKGKILFAGDGQYNNQSASIALALGDADTGFSWIGDGNFEITANSTSVVDITKVHFDALKPLKQNGHQVWHYGNMGSGSGLDADTLRGFYPSDVVQSETLARRDSSGDIRARLFRSEYSVDNDQPNYFMTQKKLGTSDNYLRPSSASSVRAAVMDPYYIRNDRGGETVKGDFHVNGGKFYWGSNRQHNLMDNDGAGNVGVQFNMDKDKMTADGGAIEFEGSTDNSSNPSWNIKVSTGGQAEGDTVNWAHELKGVADGSFTWDDHEIWHAGNDGSGSGLDADKLDGLQASQFLRTDANDTKTGFLKFTDQGVDSGIMFSTGNDGAGIRFNNPNGNDGEMEFWSGDDRQEDFVFRQYTQSNAGASGKGVSAELLRIGNGDVKYRGYRMIHGGMADVNLSNINDLTESQLFGFGHDSTGAYSRGSYDAHGIHIDGNGQKTQIASAGTSDLRFRSDDGSGWDDWHEIAFKPSKETLLWSGRSDRGNKALSQSWKNFDWLKVILANDGFDWANTCWMRVSEMIEAGDIVDEPNYGFGEGTTQWIVRTDGNGNTFVVARENCAIARIWGVNE
ncbi:MAG: hypothetical protein CMF22_11375 [Idiomarinaceae bacterium]|nr:hypothetical protein [Idiomarinaceae bacterium]|tara:strand:- start:102830 stop:108061 length:5232 start_codon:yes stop_codon:yes gene_type:complete